MDPSKPEVNKILRSDLLLPGILVLAFILRAWGVWFGLPYLYHADEPIVVNHALAYGSGDFNPRFFNIPPLVSYLLFFCYGVFYLFARGAGFVGSVGDFENLFCADPSSFYLIARSIFGVLAGTLAVYVLYRFVKRFWNRESALWAAFFLAVNFLHARDSHYVYADIPLVLVLLAGFSVFLRISAESGLRTHLGAGCVIGLAAAVKYNGIFLVVPYLWITVRSVPWRRWLPFWLVAAAAAGAVFIALNPFSVLDARFFLKELTEQSAANRGVPVLHHFSYSLAGAFTWFALAVAVSGTIKGLFSKSLPPQAVSVFILGYYAVLCLKGQPYDRYVLPLVPFLCVMTADLLAFLKSRKVPGLLLGCLVLGIVVPPLLKIVRWDLLMSRPDTRTLAAQWIEKNIPAGTSIAIDHEFHTPRLMFSPEQLQEKLAVAEGNQERRIRAYLAKPHAPSYRLVFSVEDVSAPRFLFAEPVIARDLNALRAAGVDYVVAARENNRTDDPFLNGLVKNAVMVKTFSPYRDGFAGKIYDPQILTAGPFLWADIAARDRNGYPVMVFRLSPGKSADNIDVKPELS